MRYYEFLLEMKKQINILMLESSDEDVVMFRKLLRSLPSLPKQSCHERGQVTHISAGMADVLENIRRGSRHAQAVLK